MTSQVCSVTGKLIVKMPVCPSILRITLKWDWTLVYNLLQLRARSFFPPIDFSNDIWDWMRGHSVLSYRLDNFSDQLISFITSTVVGLYSMLQLAILSWSELAIYSTSFNSPERILHDTFILLTWFSLSFIPSVTSSDTSSVLHIPSDLAINTQLHIAFSSGIWNQ